MNDMSAYGFLAQISQPSRSASKNVVYMDAYKPKPTSMSALDNRRHLFYQELREIIAESEGAGLAIDAWSLAEAFDFVEGLDFRLPMPSPSFESDGALLLEWAKREANGELTMFSIIFHGENYIFSSMSQGKPGVNGALNCCSESRLSLYGFLSNNFMPMFYAEVRAK